MVLLALTLVACQPSPGERASSSCSTAPPPEGEVVVDQVRCEERLWVSTEGRTSDLWVASAWTRAVVRHPAEALTVPGVGGGTVVDASGWSTRDGLHEVVPLVDGGWLDVHTWAAGEDYVEVSGTVRSLPDTPAGDPGAQRVVRWVPDPWSPWLCADGADGLWIHAAGEHELLDGRLVSERMVFAHDGQITTDLAGAIRVDGTCLLASPTEAAWSWLAPDGRELSGTAGDADEVVLLRGGERVGRIRLSGDDGAFTTTVPDDVEAVRAEARGHAPGAEVPVGAGLELTPGPAGEVALTLAWEGGPARPVRVEWSDSRGRAGVEVVPGAGGVLTLGAGAYDLVLGAGPAVGSRDLRVEIPADTRVDLGGRLRWDFDPGSHVLVDLHVAGDRSRTWRGTDARALREVLATGVDFAVLTPEDDIASGELEDTWSGALAWRNGAEHTSHDGWSILSWPWSATPRHGGHGAPSIAGLGPEDALALAWGGLGKGRFTAVDLAWLEAVEGPLWRVTPRPDLVHLNRTADLEVWFEWLDQALALPPTGPLTWVEVADPSSLSASDVEDGLTRGRTCATTGPLLLLDVDGSEPGDAHTLPGPDDPVDLPARVRILAPDGSLDHAALLGTGGRVLHQWDGELASDLEAMVSSSEVWVAAMAWSGDGSQWAVSGPVWLSPPG